MTKTCFKCGKELSATTKFFHKKNDNKDGLWSQCKRCRSEYMKQYYKNSREVRLEYNRQWKTANPDKVREYNRQYYETNLEYHKQYREANSETRLKQIRQWRKDNTDKMNALNAKHRARKMNADGSHTAEEFNMVCEFFNNVCVCCGKALPLARDHVQALNNNGSDYIENIQPLCQSCNSSKSVKTIDYRPYAKPNMDYIDKMLKQIEQKI